MTSATNPNPVGQFTTNAFLFSCLCDLSILPNQTPLICDYVGSDLTGDAQALFRQRHADRNADKPKKLQALRIVHVNDDATRSATVSTLDAWWRECSELLASPLISSEQDTLRSLRSFTYFGGPLVSRRASNTTKAVDGTGTTQGICLSAIDCDDGVGVGTIEYLFTSPQNILGRFRGERVIEGVGTALVERQILQVIHESGKLDIMIRLHAQPIARKFFENLHFAPICEDPYSDANKSRFTHVLKGDRVLSFMRDFAGRSYFLV